MELQCIELCRRCGISVEKADETDGGIAIYNITSPKFMLEQAEQSGRLDRDDFDEQTIIELFGKAGAQLLISYEVGSFFTLKRRNNQIWHFN